jgi:hypothetical protein
LFPIKSSAYQIWLVKSQQFQTYTDIMLQPVFTQMVGLHFGYPHYYNKEQLLQQTREQC